jgi:hypothetical protein
VQAWKINDNFFVGVADAFYRNLDGPGVPTWIEYKYIKKLPKRETTLIKPKVSEMQVKWLHDAKRAGENAFVVVGYKSQGVVYSLDELDGIPVTDFKKRLMHYQHLAYWIERTVKRAA